MDGRLVLAKIDQETERTFNPFSVSQIRYYR